MAASEHTECIGLLPAVFQAQRLRDKFRIHETAPAGLDGQIILASQRPFLFDAHAHLMNLFLPVRCVGNDARSL